MILDAKISIFGHLGGEPEMRYMPSGKAVTNFSVATTRKWKDNNGQDVKETTWFRISAYEGRAETLQKYFHKGDPIYLEGRLAVDPQTGGPRLWTRQDGTVGSSFEVALSDFRFIGNKGDNGNGNGNGNGASSGQSDEFPLDESAAAPAPAGGIDKDGFPI